MGRGKQLSVEETSAIKAYKDCGQSNRQIALKLGRSEHCIRNYYKLMENYGKNWKSKGNMKVNERTKKHIFHNAVNNHMNSADIKAQMQLPITSRRVRQILHQNPLAGWCKRVSKPNITPLHAKARLAFARQHMAWTDAWYNVVFTDEKKFNLDGPDGSQYYWHDLRKEPEKCFTRNFGGGTVMVWGGFSFNGTLPLAWISTRMTAGNYTDMLEISLIEHAEQLMGPDFIFQQDNAAIHRAKHTKKWLQDRNIVSLEWPARSPDLNPIENLWGMLAREVYKNGRQFQTVLELKTAIRQAWAQLPIGKLQNLIKSMPERIFSVISNKGGPTKY
jgi:transposase